MTKRQIFFLIAAALLLITAVVASSLPYATEQGSTFSTAVFYVFYIPAMICLLSMSKPRSVSANVPLASTTATPYEKGYYAGLRNIKHAPLELQADASYQNGYKDAVSGKPKRVTSS